MFLFFQQSNSFHVRVIFLKININCCGVYEIWDMPVESNDAELN